MADDVIFERWGDVPANIPRITVRASDNPAPTPTNDVRFERWGDAPSVMSDIARSGWSGLNAGIAALAGLPDTLSTIGSAGLEKATQGVTSALGVNYERPTVQNSPLRGSLPTTQGTQAILNEYVPGADYQPRTVPGQYAHTVGEFVPGAVLAPGGVVGNAVRYGVIPGLASEAAGRLPGVKGTAFEPVARTGAALLSAGGAAALSRPGTAAKAIRAQMPEGVTPQMVDQAGALINDAAQQGITLSWPEALSQVAGRPVMSDLARHLEAAPATQARMTDFYAGRPQQVDAAGRQAMDLLGPATPNPSMIGAQASEAATGILDRIRGAINTATRPSYDAARQSLVPQNVHAAMMRDPLFARTLNEIRTNPELSGPYTGLSDRSSIVYDGVKKVLEQRAQNLRNPINPNASQEAAANVGTAAEGARNIAVASDRAALGIAPGAPQMGNLEQALADQAMLRRRYLEPLQRGPIGRLAERDTTTRSAINALFPANPEAGSAQEIEQAVRMLANRSPNVAGQLVRAHAESVFNEATQALQSGANPAGGAKFRSILVGNPQQRANFEAAVRALPHGDQRLEGFNRFLDIMEAIGTRQNIGSKTAYNAEFLKEASSSGIPGEIVKGAANPVSRFTQGLVQKYEQYRLGRNLNELADILTNPAAVGQLRAIARMPVNSPQAANVALRIMTLTNTSTSRNSPVQQSR